VFKTVIVNGSAAGLHEVMSDSPCMYVCMGAFITHLFSERELMFTFAICCRPSVCLSVCLSVTLVDPTQAVVIFGNISTAFGTLAIR